MQILNQGSWNMLIIPALQRLRQEDLQFKVSLGYITRSCFKKCKFSGLTLQIY
jgi:hypothetical protein